MKSRMRKAAAAMLGIGMLLCCTLPVGAASKTGTGKVTFDGKKLTTDYSKESVAEAFAGMVPGDMATYTITLQNRGGTTADWYVKNDVLQSFEDKSTAANGAYTYTLEYISPAETVTTIFTSKTVGGESAASAEDSQVGLHQAGGPTADYYFLGSANAGEDCRFRIKVGLDGESQTNTYMSTLANLKVEFAVEARETSGTGDGTGGIGGYGGIGGNATSYGLFSPQTGDANEVMTYLARILAAAALVVLFVIMDKKKRR